MSYRVCYGIVTETIEDPDQMVLVDCPDDWAEYDSDTLANLIAIDMKADPTSDIGEYVALQTMVGFNDIIESFRLAMFTEGVPQDTLDIIITTVTDAVVNNL